MTTFIWFVSGSILLGFAFDLRYWEHAFLLIGVACIAQAVKESE